MIVDHRTRHRPESLAPGLSVVVPVYNSEATLGPLVEKLEPALTALVGAGNFELILVNDGSRDRSGDVARDLAARHPWITAISLMRNYGQHNALLCGIRQAHFEFLVTMDDDLQHDPADIAPLLERLREGFDVVYGPPVDAKHSFLRNLASQMTKLALQGAMGGGIARHVSAFRIMRTGIRRAFHHFHGPQANIDVMLTWGTRRFSAVPVPHHPRAVGVSNYTVGKLIAHAMNMITGFTVLPLQIASLLGFGFMLFGAGLLMWIVGMWLFVGQAPAGFAFLGSSIAIFSGVQLFCLGIIGEYLARIHFRIMERPTYTVGEIKEGRAEKSPPVPPASQA